MPHLLLFVPCERVILAEDQTVSLLTVVETLQLEVAPDHQVPEDSDLLVPFVWQAISLWTKDPDDPPQFEFEQNLQLEMPDGSVPIQLSLTTQFVPDKMNCRGIFKILGFPVVRETGTANVKLLARVGGKDWFKAGSIPILLKVPPKQ